MRNLTEQIDYTVENLFNKTLMDGVWQFIAQYQYYSTPITENDEIQWRRENFDFFNSDVLKPVLEFLQFFVN